MNMKMKYQKGMTLIELLVASFISIIVSSGMVVLMASTLGTGTQTIKMTQLSKEMRSAMQIMTRELRRANYHSTYTACFGDLDCLTTLGIVSEVAEININSTNDCLWFWYDRPQAIGDSQIAVNNETVAGFRRAVNGDIGVLQMTVSGTSAASCPAAGWVDNTNSDLVDIEAFNVDDSVPDFKSYCYPPTIPPSITCSQSQSVERIGIVMTGRLRTSDMSLPAWMRGGGDLPLTIRDFIRVRNDVYNL
jgi:type II secretory pathway component PulJ